MMGTSSGRPTSSEGYLTIADLVAMPHLGLKLVAGHAAAANPVQWTHVSELADPGPWLEGGELLVVNGFGIPETPEGQVEYLDRLVHHRLAGLAVSVRGPELSVELIAEADRHAFPVLRIPRQIPFIELSYLVAGVSERAARERLTRHLRIVDALRLRNGVDGNIVRFYSQLEKISGYRLALVSPAGRPLLNEWPWVPAELDLDDLGEPVSDLRVIEGGYVLPLFVGTSVTAFLVGMEHSDATPGGLAALQYVGTLAALDAVDDQRRREVRHREGSVLFAAALAEGADAEKMGERFLSSGLDPGRGLRLLALAGEDGSASEEVRVRNWLADRKLPHLLLDQERLLAVVEGEGPDLDRLVTDLNLCVGASESEHDLSALTRMRNQALWALRIARDSEAPAVVLAETQVGLARWLTSDTEAMKQLADRALRPLVAYDTEYGTELLRTLIEYFQQQGRIRQAASRLYIHEHTLSYRLKRIEQLTGRNLKTYRDCFELWLATEASALIDLQ